MRVREIPLKTLEDELIAIQGFVVREEAQFFVTGATLVLNWLLNPAAPSPSQFLAEASDVVFKQ